MKRILLLIATLCVLMSGSCFASPSDSERLDTLEEEIISLKKKAAKNKKSNRRLRSNFNDFQNKLSIKGFISAGLSQSNRDNMYYFVSNDLSTLPRGRMGLQTDFKISDNVKAVVQLLAKATSDDWNIGTEWAYVSYKTDFNAEFRAGRIRLPAFYFSETIEVGYSYPWVTPPWESYGAVPFRNMDGLDFTYLWVNGDWASKFKIAFGMNSVKIGVGESDGDNLDSERLIGLEYIGSSTNWQTRVAYGQTKTLYEQNSGPLSAEGDFKFASIALSYDNDDWMIIAEGTALVADDERQVFGSDLVADVNASYIMIGRRFGGYLPFFTFAANRTTDNDTRAPGLFSELFNRTQKSYSLGLRKDLSPGVAVKFEINYATDFEDTIAEFSWAFDEDGGAVLPDFDDIFIFNLAVDATF